MKTLAKKDINKILGIWAQKHALLAPAKMDNGDCIFGAFNEKTFTLDYKKPPLSPKSFFFPQAEVIFRVENNKYNEVVAAKKGLIFGLRSCDMMGIRQSSSFMFRDNEDIYYKAKQSSAAMVVMACPHAQNETCFCTTTLSGPVAKKGFDLQLYDTGDVFLVEVGSPRGEELLVGIPLAEMEESKAKQKIDEFIKKARQSIPEVKLVASAMEKLKDKKVAEKVWDDFGAKCITCGGCAFVCPTCTCFNVYDHQYSPGNGLRLRAWDACLYGGFTREASGHNPRASQALRLKRRHEHKLLDYNSTDIQDGLCGCVGCGRCSDYCPVHIGTLEVVKAIAG
ncbi:MAG: 4Fe-4S dicluster domain-containing protein [Syntrophaceae bacterium]|nr:4Fe-4S dicluster domain-containing protein [Syntrophaceae bacterium]